MPREFNVCGTVKFDYDIDIIAETEEEAETLAKEQILDFYHLDVDGAHHRLGDVQFDASAGEYQDED